MFDTRTAILSYANGRNSFRFSDLLTHLNSLFAISKLNLSWYLREMVKRDVLFKLGRGIYTAHHTQSRKYEMTLEGKTVKAAKAIAKEFPFITVSAFDGSVFMDFQQHLTANNLHYIEVDKEVTESVFHYLKSSGYRAYLCPNKNFMYDNVDIYSDAFIVKPLISESPLIEVQGVMAPMLEKILVDILCDDDLHYLQGSEWYHIFHNAHTQYFVSRTTMLRYASRRHAKADIEKAIQQFEMSHD